MVGEVSTLSGVLYKVISDFSTVTTKPHGSFTLLCTFGTYKLLVTTMSSSASFIHVAIYGIHKTMCLVG